MLKVHFPSVRAVCVGGNGRMRQMAVVMASHYSCLEDLCKNSTSGPFPRSIPARTILDYLLIPIKLIKWRELTFLHKQNMKCRETPGREHPAQQSKNPSGKLDMLNHVRFVLPFFFFFKGPYIFTSTASRHKVCQHIWLKMSKWLSVSCHKQTPSPCDTRTALHQEQRHALACWVGHCSLWLYLSSTIY